MLNLAFVLGRVCIPILFILAGAQKLLHVEDVAGLLESNRVPLPDVIVPFLGGMPKYVALGYLVGALELVCGLMIMIGLKARWGALVLIMFTAATIALVHNFWDMTGEAAQRHQIDALKNLSIIGGLLLLVAVGSHLPSQSERSR